MARATVSSSVAVVIAVAVAIATPSVATAHEAATVARRGPPVLPPLPGERGSTPDPTPTESPKPTQPSTTQPKPAQPKPAQPQPDPARAAAPTTSPSSPSDALGPPPPPPAADDAMQGEPLAPPPADSADAPAPPIEGELPESVDAPTMPRFPPPVRPPYRGTGLFISAGVVFAIAVTEQAVAHVLIKKRCIGPIGKELAAMQAAMDDPIDPTVDMDGDGVPDILEIDSDAERAGELVVDCIPGVIPALALRVHSDLALLAAIGLTAAGGIMRGRRDAYDDVFGDRPRRTVTAFRIAGLSLVATGIATWFATGAGSWGWLASCKSTKCAERARIMNFTTRDVSALLVASGGGMLGFAEAYRRNYDRFERDRALSIGPTMSRYGAGIAIAGKF